MISMPFSSLYAGQRLIAERNKPGNVLMLI